MAIHKQDSLRAIDLYSGIGGWSLGLKLAGIDVVASYEWWKKAARTNEKNNGHIATDIDIRTLNLEDLPKDIDIVVGSPPCTQFSFANRGGNGDIEDGLKDIEKFLSIVEYLKPRFWAMENVPRTAEILRQRLAKGESLERFAKLNPNIMTVDMSEWGLPQARRRCIVGNFNFALLFEYRDFVKRRTLGDVVGALNRSIIFDPIYGTRLIKSGLSDHLTEQPLSTEEVRINRESKTHHPIYNNMSFPDLLSRPSRTITATCTRVSRESVVIDDHVNAGQYRRLSVRERGSLQGFPITYQFYGDSYAEKLKMIGNAVPPLFTYYVAQSMLNTLPEKLEAPGEAIKRYSPPEEKPPVTVPDKSGVTYPPTRRFRLAIPNLRFKSGVRFELANSFSTDQIEWRVGFYYGDSKNIRQLSLSGELLDELMELPEISELSGAIKQILEDIYFQIDRVSAVELQDRWTHKSNEGAHPFEIVDFLGQTASELISLMDAESINADLVIQELFLQPSKTRGYEKLLRNSLPVLVGILIGSAANDRFESDLFTRKVKARSVRAI